MVSSKKMQIYQRWKMIHKIFYSNHKTIIKRSNKLFDMSVNPK